MKTIVTINHIDYELVKTEGIKNSCSACALMWYCWDQGSAAPPCLDFTNDPEWYFVKVDNEKEEKTMIMKKNVKEKARNAYFDSDRSERGSLGNYIDGFNDGFFDALDKIKAILDEQPNNKERLENITKMIEEYGHERD